MYMKRERISQCPLDRPTAAISKQSTTTSRFQCILEMVITMKLGGAKRRLVFRKGAWVDTKPYEFTNQDFFKMLEDQPTGSLILQLWEDNKRLKDAAALTKLVREALNKGNTSEDDCVDKSDSVEVKDPGKGGNKKEANKKGGNKKGANKKGGNKKGSDKNGSDKKKGGNNDLEVTNPGEKKGANKKGRDKKKGGNNDVQSSNKKGGRSTKNDGSRSGRKRKPKLSK